LAQSSGNSALDHAIFSVFDKLDGCKLSEMLVEKLRKSSIQAIPMTFSFGDSCRLNVPREVTEKAQTKLQEHLKNSFSEIGRYIAVLRKKIVNQWELPATNNKYRKLEAQIIVRIDKNGNVISTEWERASGNSIFDTSCLEAVQKASPLPLPPNKIWEEVYADGLLFEFSPNLKK